MPRLTFEGATDHVRLWARLKSDFVDLRGETEGRDHKAIPNTTNADVLQLATLWTRDLEAAKGRRGYDGARRRWQAALDEIARLSAGRDGGEVYVNNQRFWDETRRVAIWLESVKNLPSRWELLVEAVEETLGGVGRASARAAGELFGSLGKPVLIGAGVVGGLLLLSRGGRS